MANNEKKYLLANIIALMALSILGFLIFTLSKQLVFHNIYVLAIVIPPFINGLTYMVHKGQKDIRKEFVRTIMSSFAIRFFIILALVVLFLIIINDANVRMAFVVQLFITYSVFTFLEIRHLMDFYKKA